MAIFLNIFIYMYIYSFKISLTATFYISVDFLKIVNKMFLFTNLYLFILLIPVFKKLFNNY